MKNIEICFPDGKRETKPYGLRPIEVIQRLDSPKDQGQGPIVAALVNKEVYSLWHRVEINCSLEPVYLASSLGLAVYRRSLCFLLAMAARELFPGRGLRLGHSLGDGYYHDFTDEGPITLDDIEKLQTRMRSIVAEDQAIRHSVISYQDAIDSFSASGQGDTLLLLSKLNRPCVSVHTCRGFMDLAIAPLAPATGLLRHFELMPYEQGFLLRYPPADAPERLGAFVDSPLLYSIYREYKHWGRVLGLSSVGALNARTRQHDIKALVEVAEALHNNKIAEIADKVAQRAGEVRAVLIAGPSSSGKTTFSKKLSIQLTVLGLRPITLSLDDYFLDRERSPRDAQGNYDFECLEALDVEYLNAQLLALFSGEEVEPPIFDFKLGQRRPSGRHMRLGDRDVLIMEGIHALNDRLTPRIPREVKYKVYVSALTQLNIDDHNRVPTSDNRLIRRLVRDFQFRGHEAMATLGMWPSVQRGEQRHIFPFQNQADAAFNSALDYELSVLRVYAEPLLRAVKPGCPEYAEAIRILNFMDFFNPIPADKVPRDSILREFIGDSGFKY